MDSQKIIKYISETSIDDMINSIERRNTDIDHVIEVSLRSRKEYGLKVQEFVEKLAEMKKHR